MTRRRRPRTSEERLVAAVGSVARGVVGGRVRNVRQAPPLERNTGTTTSGFGSDLDPVVIGSGADGGGAVGAVSIGLNAAVTSSAIHAVAVGDSAQAGGDSAVAVGRSANAQGVDTIAIGESALAVTDNGVAVGVSSWAEGHSATAVGYTAHANGIGSTAVGIGAKAVAGNSTALGQFAQVNSAAHLNSTAIGVAAFTTAAHQVMLGTSAETVVLPGNLDVTALPTSDPGVSGLVWNNAGVLTVSP